MCPASNGQIDSRRNLAIPRSKAYGLAELEACDMSRLWTSMAAVVLLTGCVSPQRIERARTDAAIYGEQQRARDVRERCIDGGALPGTTAYLECQLKLTKPAQKPPNR